MITRLAPLPPVHPAQKGSAAALREAAAGVEAMFLRQMLAAARQTSLAGEDDLFAADSGAHFAEMRDAAFAEIAAKADTLGLSRFFAETLGKAES